MRRWKAHETDHIAIGDAMKAISDRLDAHLQIEKDRELVVEARLGPVRRGMNLIVREWRTITIIAFLIFDLAGKFLGYVT